MGIPRRQASVGASGCLEAEAPCVLLAAWQQQYPGEIKRERVRLTQMGDERAGGSVSGMVHFQDSDGGARYEVALEVIGGARRPESHQQQFCVADLRVLRTYKAVNNDQHVWFYLG